MHPLNTPQTEAATTLQGPLLILAGAGSGKTRVLTHRICNLILNGEASPAEILAVTFTNKAAREMEHRTAQLLKDNGVPIYDKLWISTFHSTCSRILRDDIHRLGYQPFFIIYDDSDQLSVLKNILKDLNINDKIYPPKSLKGQISNAKMLGLEPDTVAKKAFFTMDDRALEVFREYEERLKSSNALDFDDLLLKTHKLFQMHPDILQKYRERFRFIMVDEYQDTNHIQYLLVKMLAEGHRNLCVVGDEDQSIYSWRGADIRNILDFEKDFPEAKVVKLEENYRSSKNIVESASFLIRKNTERKDKVLFTNNEAGSKIVVQAENNEYDEARFVVRRIQDLQMNGQFNYNDYAVFYRTNAQSRVLEEQMRSYSVPYRLVGAVRFYDRMEVKNVICYLRLLLNATDDVAFHRILNVPARGIGKTTGDKLLQYQNEFRVPALVAAEEMAQKRLVHAGSCNKLNQFINLIEKLKKASKELSLSELYIRVLEDTGYGASLKQENTPEAQNRLDNLEELHNAILQFEKERGDEATLQSFLEEMALVSEADKQNMDEDAVTLMTLHLSKGLEFKNVFVVGLEEGLFPSIRNNNSSDDSAIEEERRLAYVGMTRARENLHLSFARTRRVWGQEESRPPSRFIKEIPEKYIATNAPIKRPAFLERYEEKYGAADSYSHDDLDQNTNNRTQSRSFSEISAQRGNDVFPDYEDMSDDNTQNIGFTKGTRVRHPVFGVGSIFEVEGIGESQKVSVLFNDRSLKKFMVKHARLQRV